MTPPPLLTPSGPRDPAGTTQLLDNIAWHSLSGAQAHRATGTATARRYAPGFSAIIAFANAAQPDFAALMDYCEPGEHFYCVGWSGAAPAGWVIDAEKTIVKMLWRGAMPDADEAPEALALGSQHVPQALALATLTQPGPFGPRTIELGEYFGCFEGQRLVAMAGERMFAGTLREISGVCTQPEFQGRGLARRLMRKLIHRQMMRRETPFLHVMQDNSAALQLYERMGFGIYSVAVARVVSREATRRP